MLFAARDGEWRRFDAPGLEELVVAGLDGESVWSSGGGCSPTPSLRRGVVPDGRVALPLPRELEGFQSFRQGGSTTRPH